MNVCNILVPGSGSVPGCSCVPDPRAAPACRQVLAEPRGNACVHLSRVCQASIPDPLTAGFDALNLVWCVSCLCGHFPVKKRRGEKNFAKIVCKETHKQCLQKHAGILHVGKRCSLLGGGGALGLVVLKGRTEGDGGELSCMSLSLAHSLWLDEHSDRWALSHGMLSLCPPSPLAPYYLREGP